MLNHVVLIGELTSINDNNIGLLVDGDVNVTVTMSNSFIDVIRDANYTPVLVGVKGQIAMNDDNTLCINANQMSVISHEKQLSKSTKQKELSR